MAIVTDMFNTDAYKATRTALHANRMRQQLIASNVANIDTPGFKTRDLDFGRVFDIENDDLSLKLSRTHERHMPRIEGADVFDDAVFYAYHPKNPNDGINDVDLDREMVKNNETSLNFSIYSKLIKSKYQGLKEVIEASQ